MKPSWTESRALRDEQYESFSENVSHMVNPTFQTGGGACSWLQCQKGLSPVQPAGVIVVEG
jgi:hypothetical protein